MVDRTSDSLEPLLAPTLRVLIAVPLGLMLLPLLLTLLMPTNIDGVWPAPGEVIRTGAPFLVAELIALGLLAIPGLPARLGRWFLPLTLFFCTLGPVATLFVYITRFNAGTIGGGAALSLPVFGATGIWPLTFFLTIPLIVIAWQYSFRWSVAYTFGLALIDVGMAIYLMRMGSADAAWVLLQLSLGRASVFLANSYLVSRLVANQRQQNTALARANNQLVHYALTQEQLAVSRERNRLARDLHDTLAHYMSGLVLELEGTRLQWQIDSNQAQATLDTAIVTARTGLVETRRALQALRATPLADLGFSGAVRELAEGMAARNQWQLQLNMPRVPVVLPPMVDETVYRIIQESLTNIERHACAKAVMLVLEAAGDDLHLQIADDGYGFDMAATDPEANFGLLGMRERSELVGGKLTMRSAPGRGTTLDFSLDFRHAIAAFNETQTPVTVGDKMETSA